MNYPTTKAPGREKGHEMVKSYLPDENLSCRAQFWAVLQWLAQPKSIVALHCLNFHLDFLDVAVRVGHLHI